MRPLVSAREISKSFGGVQVIAGASFDIFDRDRIGLVGRNGAGKSTLLRLIMGEETPDTGTVELKPGLQVGFLSQYQTQDSDETIGRNLRSSDYLAGVQGELRGIESKMMDQDFYGSEGYDEAMRRYAELQAGLAKFEGEGFKLRVVELLADLGLEPDMEQPIRTLSGGERRKLALAKLLVASPDLDLLFLDEPTNHLDISTIEWLETFLLDYRGSVIIVSHDRYLLDDTVDRVFDMEAGRVRSYVGDYTDYAQQKEALLASNTKAYKKYVKEVQRQRSIIQKLKGRNRFDAQIKSKLTRIAKMGKVDDPVLRQRVVKFKFNEAGIHARTVIEAEGLEMGFGGRTLFKRGSFEIDNGDKVGVIGPNGCGKTTLLKLLLGEMEPTGGRLRMSKNLKPGHFDQGHLSLDPENDLIQEMQSLDGKMHEHDAKALLGRFMFRGEMLEHKVKNLSGGEKARLAILKLVVSPCSLLLLDEPTNHLDIPSQQVVETALNTYAGTAFLISHDRYFLDCVADKILSFRDGKLEMHTGNYTAYRARATSSTVSGGVDVPVKYVVEKKFTDWETGRRFVPGEVVELSGEDMMRFRWALETGRLVEKDTGPV